MPISVILQFRPKGTVSIPATTGNLVHAWFLELIRAQDPALAERLHADDREKPFTVSPINGKIERREGRWWLRPDQRYWVRFTGLEKELSEILGALSLKSGDFMGFQHVPCQILDVLPRDHEWAGTTTYEQIFAEAVKAEEADGLSVRLRYVSPTTFRRGDRNEPFPLPELVFGGLARKWDAYAPYPMGPELAARMTEAVMLSRYSLTTRMQDFGHYRLVGFTGECEYRLPVGTDPVIGQAVRALAAFAFYAGVGYHTTMGMGQVRAEGGHPCGSS
jgi:CRISPR-associated endoribonuclease Cas6